MSILSAPDPEGFLVLHLALDAVVACDTGEKRAVSTGGSNPKRKTIIGAQVLALTVILYYLRQGPAAEAPFSSSGW